VKLPLTQTYNQKNIQGLPVEILNMKRDAKFSSGIGVLAQLNGFGEPVWLTIDWVLPIKRSAQQSVQATAATPRKIGAKSKSKVARKSRSA